MGVRISGASTFSSAAHRGETSGAAVRRCSCLFIAAQGLVQLQVHLLTHERPGSHIGTLAALLLGLQQINKFDVAYVGKLNSMLRAM